MWMKLTVFVACLTTVISAQTEKSAVDALIGDGGHTGLQAPAAGKAIKEVEGVISHQIHIAAHHVMASIEQSLPRAVHIAQEEINKLENVLAKFRGGQTAARVEDEKWFHKHNGILTKLDNDFEQIRNKLQKLEEKTAMAKGKVEEEPQQWLIPLILFEVGFFVYVLWGPIRHVMKKEYPDSIL